MQSLPSLSLAARDLITVRWSHKHGECCWRTDAQHKNNFSPHQHLSLGSLSSNVKSHIGLTPQHTAYLDNGSYKLRESHRISAQGSPQLLTQLGPWQFRSYSYKNKHRDAPGIRCSPFLSLLAINLPSRLDGPLGDGMGAILDKYVFCITTIHPRRQSRLVASVLRV